ncbi:hypothetical protein [Lacticaseibacillus paracasei]|uniref:hypothetical protein n=1 Tax=Lacticaseibacillus paracasei TaxID=1597 RepID=UPI0031F608FD
MARINFSFYNAFIQFDGENTDFPVENVITHIANFDEPRNRTAFIKGSYHSLPKFRTFDGAREGENLFFWIGRFFTERPYTGQLNEDEFRLMIGDPYSPAIVVYRPEDHLLAVQSKRLAPRRRAIEEFFNHFIEHNVEGHVVKLVLIPQHDTTSLEAVNENATVSSIHLEIDANNDIELQALADANQNRFSEIVNNNARDAREIGANVVNIDWKKGRLKKPISFDVIQMLRGLDFDNSSILKAEVTVKLNHQNTKKTINLLEDGLLKDSFEIGDGITAFDALVEATHDHIQNAGIPNQCFQYFLNNYRENLIRMEFGVHVLEE